MELTYFNEVENFGDALNPYIFHHFLPGFFDNDPKVAFFGIGSILGFGLAKQARKKIVFSTGFAYGEKPVLDESYDVKCVRGPLTAKALQLPQEKAVADGALLLQFMDIPKPKKEYAFSFMPHLGSVQKYSRWGRISQEAGIKLINPLDDKEQVLQDILKSEVVIAEAMHGAIVADTLGVPWIPLKAYPTINEFKWQDWAQSVELSFDFRHIPSMYENNDFVTGILTKKSKGVVPRQIFGLLFSVLEKTYFQPREGKVIKELERIKACPPVLSSREIVKSRGEQLLDKIGEVRREYGTK